VHSGTGVHQTTLKVLPILSADPPHTSVQTPEGQFPEQPKTLR